MKAKTFFYTLTALVSLPFFVSLSSAGAMSQQCEEAQKHFKQALNIKVEGADIRGLMEKETLYRQAVSLCPDFAEAHNNLGDVYENLGKYSEAMDEYQKAVNLKKDFPAPYSGLGDICFKSGDYQEAIKWYDLALKLDPKDSISQSLRMQATALATSKVIPKDAIVRVLGRPQVLTRDPGDAVKITFGADPLKGSIPFDYNEWAIRQDAKAQLGELGQALANAELSEYVFEIGGHTDIRGSDAYNIELSLKRATAVRDYLVNHFQISASRLKVKGFGKSRLIAMGDDEASHAMNRRVDITRLGKSGEVALEKDLGSTKGRIAVDLGFLYRDGTTGKRSQINPNGQTVLRTGKDLYQVFFRPRQICYVYLLQKDATGKWYVLFPQKESAFNSNPVQSGKDYWLPGFDQGFPGDENRGEETLYFLASLWEMKELESPGPGLQEAVAPIARGFTTRGLSHIGKPEVPTPAAAGLPKRPATVPAKPATASGVTDYAKMINHIESDGALVKTVSFMHQ